MESSLFSPTARRPILTSSFAQQWIANSSLCSINNEQLERVREHWHHLHLLRVVAEVFRQVSLKMSPSEWRGKRAMNKRSTWICQVIGRSPRSLQRSPSSFAWQRRSLPHSMSRSHSIEDGSMVPRRWMDGEDLDCCNSRHRAAKKDIQEVFLRRFKQIRTLSGQLVAGGRLFQ